MAGNAAGRIGDRVFDMANSAGRSTPALQCGAMTEGAGPLDVAGVEMADGVTALDTAALIADGFAIPVAQILGVRIGHLDRMGRPGVMAVFEAGEGGIEIIVATQGALTPRFEISQGDIESNIAPRPAPLTVAALASGDVPAGGAAVVDRIAPGQVSG